LGKIFNSQNGKEIELENSEKLENLLDELKLLLASRANNSLKNWQRLLPFGDYISDRWEKGRILGFGEGTSIYDSAIVIGKVKVGRNTWIGPFTVLDGSGGLEIGDFCSISAGVQIYSHDTVAWAITGGEAPTTHLATKIGDRCYLGPNVVVAKGVTIGSGSIIGANSFVNSNIPDGVKAWGSPAKIAGS
jgi:acetyltransferase-like isoleucine patch superfamily enzyme